MLSKMTSAFAMRRSCGEHAWSVSLGVRGQCADGLLDRLGLGCDDTGSVQRDRRRRLDPDADSSRSISPGISRIISTTAAQMDTPAEFIPCGRATAHRPTALPLLSRVKSFGPSGLRPVVRFRHQRLPFGDLHVRTRLQALRHSHAGASRSQARLSWSSRQSSFGSDVRPGSGARHAGRVPCSIRLLPVMHGRAWRAKTGMVRQRDGAVRWLACQLQAGLRLLGLLLQRR